MPTAEGSARHYNWVSNDPKNWKIRFDLQALNEAMTAGFGQDFAADKPVPTLRTLAQAGVMLRFYLPDPSTVKSTHDIQAHVRDGSPTLQAFDESLAKLGLSMDESTFRKMEHVLRAKVNELCDNLEKLRAVGLEHCYEDLALAGWVEVEHEDEYEMVPDAEEEDELVREMVQLVRFNMRRASRPPPK
ncbi:hypothetical protein M011DRAFT_286378 [Sporormia fimetaria CBS 119925]|uniref:Uncharacterized protein n=1 Tax=Sporormia fimetaria CBS 119925 TaxID=1340428 RepID=A0A6A6VKE7_9PLEO|nr:hypothetical protein M011DRAFT_286378 [Sporormia fimetaria CBS 119925]